VQVLLRILRQDGDGSLAVAGLLGMRDQQTIRYCTRAIGILLYFANRCLHKFVRLVCGHVAQPNLNVLMSILCGLGCASNDSTQPLTDTAVYKKLII